jgi:Icc-related predicted phosphoesterase
MRIETIDTSPFHTFPQQIAAGGGRTMTCPVNIYRGTVQGLPGSLDAVLVASDLQGVAALPTEEGVTRLVGEALAEHLAKLADEGRIPPLSKVGVVLAGDLYSSPSADERGASGDVRPVWRAFAARHRWVVGVAGNHDRFGSTSEERELFQAEPAIHVLDGECVELDGLRIGGVGGIIGDPAKPARREEKEFLRSLRRVLGETPAVLVMHHGPDAKRGELRGHSAIRQALDRSGELLVICGHVYWSEPTTDLRGGAQVLNADGRVVLLERG